MKKRIVRMYKVLESGLIILIPIKLSYAFPRSTIN